MRDELTWPQMLELKDATIRRLRRELREARRKPTTLCVDCGPNVAVDEDECCALCGNGAVGEWLREPTRPAKRRAK